jgi:dihydroorotate dehydrogenase (fumarate)
MTGSHTSSAHTPAPTLSTTYLGLQLSSPLVASAGPVTGDPTMWSRLEAAGAGAIVLPSLFEEEIEYDVFNVASNLDRGTDVFAESLTYFPDLDAIAAGPDKHLELVEDARERVDIPIIASINGTSPGGWVRYARALESAGAHAIELNVYDVVVDHRATAADVERRLVELVEEVRSEVSVPLAVKLGPWFTSFGHLAVALEQVGVDGLVVFNRFFQPDIDLESLTMRPALQLSSPGDIRLALHWIGVLRGDVQASLAATGGVHSGNDALKLLLAGADVVMTTSALLRHGPEHLAVMRDQIVQWLQLHEYDGVHQLRGSMARHNVPDPDVYDRANYYQVLHSWR